MLVRFVIFVAIATLYFCLAAVVSAQVDPDKPWVVTQKADNRVLPKQDVLSAPAPGAATTKAAPPKAAPAPKQAQAAQAPPSPAPVAAPVTLPAGAIGKPEFTVSAEQVLIMVPTGAMVTDTRFMNLDSPRRVAVDIMGKWTYDGRSVYPLNQGVVSKAAVGVHPDFVRVVLHLTQGPVPAEIAPRFQLVDGGLKVTVPLK